MTENLRQARNECAKTLLELYKKANAGHIGASLSCLEILVDLCFKRMAEEDVLIVSKGHAAGALYTTLAKSGRMDEEELSTYYREGTRLAAHPPCTGQIPSIPFGTGSLGHGLSLAAGIAFSQRFTGKKFHVYCVVSDGDCNEGSTWEAALFAAHHRLSNLTVIVDANGVQGLGNSREILNLEPLDEKWRAFGFSTTVVESGNSFDDLERGYERLAPTSCSFPQCLLARTVKGSGVSYMENRMEWHYLPMNDAQYRTALEELGPQNA